jgi:hypothetical protein
MADDPVDISGMPDPPQGYAEQQSDPTAGMPSPEDQYRKFYFGGGQLNANGKPGPMEPIPQDALDEFTTNPPSSDVAKNLKHGASALTGLPRVAATAALAVPAAAAGGAGALTGAVGAALDPDNAEKHLEQGRERLRDWSSGTYKLADYLPATKRGAEAADTLNSVPQQVGKNINDSVVRPIAGDNVADTLGDVASDVGTVLPAAGAGGLARAGVGAVSKAAKGTADFVKSEAASVNAPGDVPTPTKPDTVPPVSAESLRSSPNPIPPPDGTVAKAKESARVVTPPAADAPTREFADNAAATPKLPESDSAPQDMSLTKEQRAIVREGVAARRAAADSAPDSAPESIQLSPGDAQRGSTTLFRQPKDTGPQETPATPEEQLQNKAKLDALDKLSGNALPTRRTSAITGDYNATGDDWQSAKVGNEAAQRQLATENDALHAATDNVHASTGSLSSDSVDPTTLGDRGRTARGAIQAIEKHFSDATDGLYDTARAQNQGRAIPKPSRMSAYLNDDSNFTNDAEQGLQRAAKARMERLWSSGDPDSGTPPGSVNGAERLREFLNEKGKNPSAMGVAKAMKDHLDMDVAEQGGPGLFQAARAMRRHSFQMLEEPVGVKKLLAPGDSQGINHAIPEHKVMDYINELPREQHEHVMDVLRAGAHLSPEIAEQSAAAIREIQAHTISRLHDAATDEGGKWNARSFAAAAQRYGRNAESTFKDRPDILRNLETVKEAGDVLHMDKSYPGAIGQAARSGIMGAAVKGAGAVASSLAHDIPVVGRMVGRGIEGLTEGATGGMAKKAAEKAFEARTVDRNGKQRGSVRVMNDPDEEGAFEKIGKNPVVQAAGKVVPKKEDQPVRLSGSPQGVSAYSENGATHAVRRGNDLHVTGSDTARDARGNGEGNSRLVSIADRAHSQGGKMHSGDEVSEPEQRRYTGPNGLAAQGYDVKTNPHTTDPGTGVKKSASELKGVYEVGPRKGTVPSGQRGSVQLFNDSKLNRAADESRDRQTGAGIEPRNERNPRSEFNANGQMSGGRNLSAEQQEVLRRLSG